MLGPARLDAAGLPDGPAVKEQLFGERGLSGVRMTDDGKGAPARDFLFQHGHIYSLPFQKSVVQHTTLQYIPHFRFFVNESGGFF